MLEKCKVISHVIKRTKQKQTIQLMLHKAILNYTC